MWISPDTASGWSSSNNVCDGNLSTHATKDVDNGIWSPYLTCNCSVPVGCSQVRWYGSYSGTGNVIEVGIQVNSLWQVVYSGTWQKATWITQNFSPAVVQAVRLRVKPNGNETDWIAEVQLFEGIMKTLQVSYQAAGAATGKTVQVDVIKPDHTKDVSQSGTATEVGTTGRYYFSFQADAPDWSCNVSDNNGGKAVVAFPKNVWDSNGIADAVGDVNTAVAAVSSAISTLSTTVTGVGTNVSTVITDVTNVATAIAALGTQLSSIQTTIGILESPAMIG